MNFHVAKKKLQKDEKEFAGKGKYLELYMQCPMMEAQYHRRS
jgi:hypothetical protein